MKKISTRTQATKIILKVIEGDSLSAHMSTIKKHKEAAFLQMLCFGVLRHIWILDAVVESFLQKPFKEKDQDVQVLLMVGLFDLVFTETADYAAISETVAVVNSLNKAWAKGLVNAVLRNCQRALETIQGDSPSDRLFQLIQQKNPEDPEELQYNHPQWLIDQLKQDWPERWQEILTANNQQAPMSLRVNRLQFSREEFLEKLKADATACEFNQQGIILAKASDVKFLPGFAEGSCFVQDNAAQLAAELLDVQDGQKILDACAAPGGKTTHILELAPKAEVLALDNSAERLEKVKENLQRLKLTATCKVADAADLASWHAGELFDRVLLDVPCSATGVIRRHPDIKLLREAEDIAALTAVQANMLRQVWKTLKPGGKLLYATCSVLKAENLQQIEKFLQDEAGASLETINANWGHEQKVGRQVFPGEAGMDGFYYCLLSKRKDI